MQDIAFRIPEEKNVSIIMCGVGERIESRSPLMQLINNLSKDITITLIDGITLKKRTWLTRSYCLGI